MVPVDEEEAAAERAAATDAACEVWRDLNLPVAQVAAELVAALERQAGHPAPSWVLRRVAAEQRELADCIERIALEREPH